MVWLRKESKEIPSAGYTRAWVMYCAMAPNPPGYGYIRLLSYYRCAPKLPSQVIVRQNSSHVQDEFHSDKNGWISFGQFQKGRRWFQICQNQFHFIVDQAPSWYHGLGSHCPTISSMICAASIGLLAISLIYCYSIQSPLEYTDNMCGVS